MMKNWILTLLIFYGTATVALASVSTTDSLDNIRKIDSLNKLSGICFNNEKYLQSLDFKYKCYDLAKKNGDIKRQAKTLSQITIIFTFLKNFELSRKYLRINEELLDHSRDQYSSFLYNFSKANYYYELKKYDSAIHTYFSCLLILSTHPTTIEIATLYKSVGDAYSKKEQYKVALSFYAKSVNEFERINEIPYIAAVYTRIANIHYLLGDYHKNLLFNLKALEIRKKSANIAQLSSSFLNVGEAFWLLGVNDSARIYYSKSINYALESNEAFYIEVSYRSLKNFAITEGRYKDACDYYKKCIENRIKYSIKKNESEILVLETNQSINEWEAKNESIKKKILIQNLQIQKRKIQIVGFEISFLSFLALIFFLEYLLRSNRKRKLELQVLNERYIKELNDNQVAEIRLNQSEELHRFIAENTEDVISLLSCDMHRTYISNSCMKLYGFTQEEILNMGSPMDLVEPGYHANVNQRFLEILHEKKPIHHFYKAITKSGSSFWAESGMNPILDPVSKNVKEIITVVRDYSERKKFEEDLSENARQKDFLLREIHNRVKNNFAILGSLINMQRNKKSDDALASPITDLQLRIRTMALVHEQLFQSKEINTVPFDNYLQHLCAIISNSYNNKRIEITTDLSECILDIGLTLPLGLIINELLTNAFKYAFPGDKNGCIKVSLYPVEHGRFCISVSDNGIGLPDTFTMKNPLSMGTQIIEILVQQVEGELLVSNDNGACFRLIFSVSQEK